MKPGANAIFMLNTTAYYNRGGVGAPIITGYLVAAGLIRDGKPYYCPSETNPQWVYDYDAPGSLTDPLSANPWPFDPPGTGRETRLGYASRPEVAWIMPPNSGTGADLGRQTFLNAANKPCPMPKLKDYKTKAILADANMCPTHLKSRHLKGVNVLYGMGNAKWVPKEAFMKQGSAYTGIPYPPNDNSIYQSGYNAAQLNTYFNGNLLPNPTGLWIDYDKY